MPHKLSIHLIKDEYITFDQIVKDGVQEYNLNNLPKNDARLYFKKSGGEVPKWFSFFGQSIDGFNENQLKTKNVSILLLLKGEGRIFAITFGYGRNLMKLECIEERFGLRVCLNSIDHENFHVIDRKNIDSMLTQTRTQMSRKCPIEEFGLEVDRILLKAVIGDAKDEAFASKIAGADALTICCNATISDIKAKCKNILAAYRSKAYKRKFSWVDNLSLVKKQKRDELNSKMIELLKKQETEKVFMATPEVEDWTNVIGFSFTKRVNRGEAKPDIFINDYYNAFNDSDKDLSIQNLKNRYVYVEDIHGVRSPKWSVFKCLNSQIVEGDTTYILTEGSWFAVDLKYIKAINKSLSKITIHSGITLAAGEKEKESKYNKRLANSLKAALMDQRIIYYGGGQSKIEFCDVYTKDKEIIHVKRYSNSSVLSHLFSQGIVSATLFKSGEDKFREQIQKKLPQGFSISTKKIVPSAYTVVFGIISKQPDKVPLNLPFFSKITLHEAVKQLELLGYNVAVAGIQVK